MKSKLISWTVGVLAAVGVLGLAAANDVETIAKAMQKLVPGTAPDRIVASPVPGLYEVSFGPEVLYVTKDGRFAVQGDLIDVANKTNLSEERRAQGRVQLIKGLNQKDMIIFAAPPKQEKHVVTIFTDVDCSYCRKMHGEMADYNKAGITVRYLAFPRSGVDTLSYSKMVSVWCAKDRRAAMTRAKLGEAVEQKTCDNPIQKHLAAAERVGVAGTPTMVMEDGTVVPGYMPAARLSQVLDQLATAAR